jgi:hypothetical protein
MRVGRKQKLSELTDAKVRRQAVRTKPAKNRREGEFFKRIATQYPVRQQEIALTPNKDYFWRYDF